jgi:hypothetical protein
MLHLQNDPITVNANDLVFTGLILLVAIFILIFTTMLWWRVDHPLPKKDKDDDSPPPYSMV